LSLILKFELNSIGKGQFGPPGLRPIWPAGPASPPGSAKTARLGSGSNHRPSPAPHSSSSLTPELTGDWIAAAVARRFRLAPMTTAAATLGKILPSTSSFSASSWKSRNLSFRGDLGGVPFGIRRHHSPPIWCYAGLPPLGLLCLL
jgi:hypothetical protein